MRFEFATATRIIFGAGTLKEAGALAAGFGQRALVVTGASRPSPGPLLADLAECGVGCVSFAVGGEPNTEAVRLGTELARREGCDLVIAFGGGSAVDAGKAIAALLANGGEPLDYLEVIGRGKTLTRPSVPFIAIPTTAGAGAEVTRNAVLAAPEQRVKVSLRSPFLLPRVALVDPELTYGLPPAITASTGLDALTQLIEPFVSARANPLTGALCREGMARVARSLRRAFAAGHDVKAREDMSLASLFGGLALANAGLGVAHGIASVVGGMYPAPHGAICARLLPYVMETNVLALQRAHPDSPALQRYDEVGQVLTGNPAATAAAAVEWVQDLCGELRVSPLGVYGLTRQDVPLVVEKSLVASSTQANPIKLTSDEIASILSHAI
jgi:alcohol dehydrogenase class IV